MILQACPGCARQYDVAHLEVSDPVHCVCDRIFRVAQARSLSAHALLCRHCGGRVAPDEEACAYCEAEISRKDREASVVCPGCLGRFEEHCRHCPGCGLAIKPQSLLPLPPETVCPRCEGGLQHRALEEHSSVVECTDCLGVWVQQATFDALCGRALEKQVPLSALPKHQILPSEEPAGESNKAGFESKSLADKPGETRKPTGDVPGDGTGSWSEVKSTPSKTPDTLRYIRCVQCDELMLRRQFRWDKLNSHVVIDTCKGHGIWLDPGELEAVAKFLTTVDSRRGLRSSYEPKKVSTGDPMLMGMNFGDSSHRASRAALGGRVLGKTLEFLMRLLLG